MSKAFLYSNPNSHLQSNILGVVVHGGGNKPFPESHNIIQYLFKFAKDVVSLQLPNHGTLIEKKQILRDPLVALEDVRQTLLPFISGRKVFFIGYSFGGVFFTRLLPVINQVVLPRSTLVLVGSPIRPEFTYRETVEIGTSVAGIEATKSTAQVAQAHGLDWPLTLASVNAWAREDSAIWHPRDIRAEMFDSRRTPLVDGSRTNVFFICGTEDNVISIDDVVTDMDKENVAFRVFAVSCAHGDFFSSHWQPVEKILTFIFSEYGFPTPPARL